MNTITGKLFNNFTGSIKTGLSKDILAQTKTNEVQSVEEIKKENTVNYTFEDGRATLNIKLNTSKSRKTFITLNVNSNYTYELEKDGNVIKLTEFYHTAGVPVADNLEISDLTYLSKEESDKFKKYLDLMIKKTPHHKEILNYIKGKTNSGEVVLDK
ncbi:MAG: hypothetical protein ABIH00_07340 [Armatimonadota bacterium]